jgi:hypothetical protein
VSHYLFSVDRAPTSFVRLVAVTDLLLLAGAAAASWRSSAASEQDRIHAAVVSNAVREALAEVRAVIAEVS